jgi:hypothetical protein
MTSAAKELGGVTETMVPTVGRQLASVPWV